MSNNFPNNIADYVFETSVSLGQSINKKAIYSHKRKREKFFVKFFAHKKEAVNELNRQKIVYDTLVHGNTHNVSVPKPIGVEKANKEYALLSCYIHNAEGVINTTVETRVSCYMTALKVLHNAHCLHKLPKVTSVYQLASLPYFLAVNIKMFPAQTSLLLKCFAKILVHSPSMLILKHKTLCQGDFNVTNILLTEGGVVLLDFPRACISHKYFDLATALNSAWHSSGFQEQLWSSMVTEFKLLTQEKRLLNIFVLFNLMQRLCKRYEIKEQELFYINKMRTVLDNI